MRIEQEVLWNLKTGPSELQGQAPHCDCVLTSFRLHSGKVWGFEQHVERLVLGWRHYYPDFKREEQLSLEIFELVKKIRWEGRAELSDRRVTLLLKSPELPLYHRERDLYPVVQAIVRSYTEVPTEMVLGICDDRMIPCYPSYLKSNYFNERTRAWRLYPEQVDELLFCDVEGRLTDSISSNLFVMGKASIIFPYLRSGVLDGITRRYLQKYLDQNHIDYCEKDLFLSDLEKAEGVGLLNAVTGIRTVSEIRHVDISCQWSSKRMDKLKNSFHVFLNTQSEELFE